MTSPPYPPIQSSHINGYAYDEIAINDCRRVPGVVESEIRIFSKIDDFNTLEKEWNAIVLKNDTHIYQTFEWNRIWWKHFGAGKKLHIVAVYIGKILIGIAPLFKDDVTLIGKKLYTCLRFIGSYVSQPIGKPLVGNISYSDYLDFIIVPGHEPLFYQLIFKHFKGIASEIDEIILDEVPEESVLYDNLVPFVSQPDIPFTYTINDASSSPVILLESSWDSYLKSLDLKSRYTARRYYNRSKQGKAGVFRIGKVEDDSDVPAVVSCLIQMHQRQWNKRGFPGTFAEKRMHDFFIEISIQLFEKKWIEFTTAVPVEDITNYVAIDALITFKNRVYLMHRAMDENPIYRKKGPGNVLLYVKLKEAINDGVQVFDMLRGMNDFKLKMATNVHHNKNITLYSDLRKGRVLPVLLKYHLNILKKIRMERLHMTSAFKGTSIHTGITDYIRFLYNRFNKRSHN